MAETVGLYVHIPFCRSKCAYCDFYSLPGAEAKMDAYQTALLRQLRETAPLVKNERVGSVYFGGGTPSYFGARRIAELLKQIFRLYKVEKGAEITAEANPDSADYKSLLRLRRAGVNRLSLGMQSADDGELKALGRPHTFAEVRQAVDAARRAKLKNLSLDLIYGLPGQDMDSWQRSVEAALGLQPEHLSCYGLKVEEGTPLSARVREGLVLPDGDRQADMYLWMVDRLARAGYRQYEISNFAKEGFASRHNLRYWRLEPYLGFGPGAHSDFGGGRTAVVRDLDAYLAAMAGGGAILDEKETLSRRERAGEYLMLRFRLTEGVDLKEYAARYRMLTPPLEAKLRLFAENGWAEETCGRWHFTPRGFLVSNQLIGDILECQREETFESVLAGIRAREQTVGTGEKNEDNAQSETVNSL